MERVSTIGLAIAKHVFQVHGVDTEGAGVVRRRLRRDDVATFFATFPVHDPAGEKARTTSDDSAEAYAVRRETPHPAVTIAPVSTAGQK